MVDNMGFDAILYT
jgi:hypothetical protein